MTTSKFGRLKTASGFGQPVTDPHPFDYLLVSGPDGEERLTRQQFLELPLAERLTYVVEKSAVFYRAGSAISAKEALRK